MLFSLRINTDFFIKENVKHFHQFINNSDYQDEGGNIYVKHVSRLLDDYNLIILNLCKIIGALAAKFVLHCVDI